MLTLGLVSLPFSIVYCSENRSKINITPYGENFYYKTYQDKIQNLEGYIIEMFLITVKLLDGLPVFQK